MFYREQAKKFITVTRRPIKHEWLTGDILAAIKSKDPLWVHCWGFPMNAPVEGRILWRA